MAVKGATANKKAVKRKDERPHDKSKRVATWAKTMTKVVISRNNNKTPLWHVVNFIGRRKGEPRGIVDLLAIRKDQSVPALPLNRGDLFEVVLIQVKGGGARNPSIEDKKRLQIVRKKYSASAILLSAWKKGTNPKFYRLEGGVWVPVMAEAIFDKKSVKAGKGKAGKTVKKSARKTAAGTSSGSALESRSKAAKKAWVTRTGAKKRSTKR